LKYGKESKTMANDVKKYFISEDGWIFIAPIIQAAIEAANKVTISTTIDENSTNQTVAATATVRDFVNSRIAASLTTGATKVDTLPPTGTPGTLYLLRHVNNVNGEDVISFTMHVWDIIEEEWIDLGAYEINMDNFWAKDELLPMSNARLLEVWEDSAL